VALLGRLSLYGEGAARLHDEVLTVAARWTDPGARTGPLKPYAAEAESKTVELLQASLLSSKPESIPGPAQKRLLSAIRRDMADLLPSLQERGEALAEKASEKLATRADKEARDMAELLEAQRARIEATLKSHEAPSGASSSTTRTRSASSRPTAGTRPGAWPSWSRSSAPSPTGSARPTASRPGASSRSGLSTSGGVGLIGLR